MDRPAFLQVIDAFTDTPFQGNPAAVCVLAGPCDGLWMQMVAREMNLSETAFVYPLPQEEGWALRWFTPQVEVALCGHATLAAAYALWEMGKLTVRQPAKFLTESGWLTCCRTAQGIEMDFPASPIAPASPEQAAAVAEILGCPVLEVWSTPYDLLAEVASGSVLEELEPDQLRLGQLPIRGLIVTARGDARPYDFLSRFFAPSCGVAEDPVTGSAHCALGPYWQRKLAKPSFLAFQASARGGRVGITLRGDRVILQGQAVAVSRVELKTTPFPEAIRLPLGPAALGLELRQPTLEDAEELFALVEENRAYLRQWLPWLDYNQEPAATAEYIATSRQRAAQGATLDFLITRHGVILGVLGFNMINRVNRTGHIGYWLGAAQQGQGLMSRSVSALMDYGFREIGLNTIRIAAATGNAKSRAVPLRLGFQEQGTDPQSEWLYEHYVDHVNYVMTAADWADLAHESPKQK